MSPPAPGKDDRRRKTRLIVFQIVIYGYLLAMFVIQMFVFYGKPH